MIDKLQMLKDALELAKDGYFRADYIESTERRDRERLAYSIRIGALEDKIARYTPADLFGPLP